MDAVWAQDLVDKGEAGLRVRMVGPAGQRPIRLYQADDGLIFGGAKLIGIQRGEAALVLAESCPYPDAVPRLVQEVVGKIGSFEAAETLPAACVLDRMWAGNIWHWYMESVPVVAALEEAGFEGCYVVPADSAVCAESLALLDIPASRIRLGTAGVTAAKMLFFTEAFAGHQLTGWPWLLEWVRARARQQFPAEAGAERIYIARRGNARRVLNEPEVLEKLAGHGFSVAYMEDLSFGEQLCLLRDAKIVIGPHGAGLVYTMFMQRGGALIEFFHARYINPCMLPVCDMLGIDYRMVVSQVNPMDNVRKDDLIFVPMALFSLSLDCVLRRS